MPLNTFQSSESVSCVGQASHTMVPTIVNAPSKSPSVGLSFTSPCCSLGTTPNTMTGRLPAHVQVTSTVTPADTVSTMRDAQLQCILRQRVLEPGRWYTGVVRLFSLWHSFSAVVATTARRSVVKRGSCHRQQTSQRARLSSTWPVQKSCRRRSRDAVSCRRPKPATSQRLPCSRRTRGRDACLLPFSKLPLGPHVRCRVSPRPSRSGSSASCGSSCHATPASRQRRPPPSAPVNAPGRDAARPHQNAGIMTTCLWLRIWVSGSVF